MLACLSQQQWSGDPAEWGDQLPEHIRGCIGEDWAVGFGAALRECRRKLLVFVRPDVSPLQQSEQIASWLHECLTFDRCLLVCLTDPREPNRIPFAEHWQAYRAKLISLLPEQVSGRAPVLRMDVLDTCRRDHSLSFFLPGGRPCGGQSLLGWYRAATPSLRGQLVDAVRFLQRAGFDTPHPIGDTNWFGNTYCAFIGGYTHQPPGLNALPTLSFGGLDNQLNIRGWTARIYLHPGPGGPRLPIAIPGRLSKPAAIGAMSAGAHPNPGLRAYVATNLDDFYDNPRKYF